MNETGSTSNSLSERVRRRLEALSPSERRVAQYLAEMPAEELVFANAEVLGQLTRSSDATVVRTARKLGYAGLPELKREAGSALGGNRDPKERLSKKLGVLGHDLNGLRQSVFADAVRSLEETCSGLDDEAVQGAIGAMAQARQIHVYGYGGSESAARHLARSAARMGYPATASSSTGLVLADALLQIHRDAAVVIIQPGRPLRELDVLLEHVASVGATSVLVSGEPLQRELEGAFDIGLTVRFGSARLSAEALPAMVVADVLAYGLSVLEEDRALQSREVLTHLRQKLTTKRS